MRSFFKILLGASIPAPWDVWGWILASLPIISAVAAVTAGYLQDIQWMWVIVGGLLSFAAAGQGLVAFSNWRFKQRVADKLSFSIVRTGINFGPVSNAIRLGIQVSSSYDAPLECEIMKFVTIIGNRVPRPHLSLPATYRVPANGFLFFDDNTIQIDPPKGGNLDGEIEFEIAYGRPGKRRYKFNGRKRVTMLFGDTGNHIATNWTDGI